MAGKSKKPAANNLRAWREAAGMTLTKLSELTGIGVSTLSELESGEQQLTVIYLNRIAPHLGAKPGFMIEYLPGDPRIALLKAVASVAEGEPTKKAAEVIQLFSPPPEVRAPDDDLPPPPDHLQGMRAPTPAQLADQGATTLPDAKPKKKPAPSRDRQRDDG